MFVRSLSGSCDPGRCAHELLGRRQEVDRIDDRNRGNPRLRAEVERLHALDDVSSELRRFHELFPHVDQLPAELEKLFGLARGAGLDLRQGEYRLERPSAGLASYRVTLPVRGAYPQLRNFVNAVLRDLPIASIDALRFERRAAADSQLDAQLRLTVWFQNSGDTP